MTKPTLREEYLEVIYSQERWSLLKELRAKAIRLMKLLSLSNLSCIVYGSIARGDVNEASDIDVFVLNAPSSMTVELALENACIKPVRRVLVQATPSYAPKGYFEVEEHVSISLPLIKLRKVEREFYKFAGELTLDEVQLGKRVPGVDKRLMLIEPKPFGHVETSIIGRESYISKLLGISVQTVLDRARTLIKRDKVGRTGIFLEKKLTSDETFESVINELTFKNPALRRRLRSRSQK